MKRKTKNITMIFILIIMIVFTIFTTINFKDNSNNELNNSSKTMNEKPNNNGNNMIGEPPEKPDGDNFNNDNNQENKPDDNNNQNNIMDSMPSMPDNIKMNNTSSNLSTKECIIIIIQASIISLIIIYLIMSKFNKKTFKETFENKDKLIIYFLLTLILTASIFYLDNKIISKENNNMMNDNDNDNHINNNENVSYSSVKEITSDEDIDGETYSSAKKDTNVISVSGATSNLSNVTINKTGDSDSGDNTSFYGNNSGIIAKDGSTLNIKDSTVTTNANGANGIFSYGNSSSTKNSGGDSTTINVSNSKIVTKKDNSGGIMVTGGGILNATNLTVSTSGVSSAAIRSDRGGGTLTVNKGTYKTTGSGSPSIYSTADINVKNATLESSSAEGIVIEGKNSVSLDNVKLTDNNTKLNGKSTTYKNIFLYQSMSGDAEDGTSSFTSKNSEIITNKGDTFYVTNTNANITLENNSIVNNDSSSNFIRVQKDSWGNNGSNGGNVTLKMTNQLVEGNIEIDSISTLKMSLNNNSYYEGEINSNNEAKNIELSLDKSSKIKLTGDSYITSLDNKDESNSNIDFNGYRLYVNGKAIN